MPWGKMDDKFHRNRKVRELRRSKGGREALGAWVYWWSWCLDDPELTGFVPEDELPPADLKAAELLVEVKLWDRVEGGYVFHDFNDYNPTREKVDHKREADRKRIAAKREASRENVARDTEATNERVGERVAASRPVPSRPDPIPEETTLSLARAIPPPEEKPPETTASKAKRRIHEATLISWDFHQWKADLAWIGEQPDEQLSRVLANLMADPWVRQKTSRASPSYIRKHWPRFLEPEPAAPPQRMKLIGPAPASPRENFLEPDDFDADMRRAEELDRQMGLVGGVNARR